MLPIRLRGARTHNLQGVDLELRPGELVAVTGVSGAGKSSLALDTLYSEGQRRFVESFSPYARQFLERLERPPIESLDPVAAGVAVDRRAPVKSSRSTVATMADLEPYLCALFGREAMPECPDCKLYAVPTDAAIAAGSVTGVHEGRAAVITYSLPLKNTEQFLDARESLATAGYRRALVRGEARDLDEVKPSDVLSSGAGLEVVVDRVRLGKADERRLGAALEEAWSRGDGRAALVFAEPEPEVAVGGALALAAAEPVTAGAAATKRASKGQRYTARHPVARGLACPKCARTFEPPRPGLFSYQSPTGACGDCRGFGRTIGIDWAKVIPDERKTLAKGAVRPWSGMSTTWERKSLKGWCAREFIPMDVPWGELTEEQREKVLAGEGSYTGGKYPGVRAWFKWLEGRTYKMHVRVLLSRYRSYDPCAGCGGKRLSAASLRYRVGGIDLASFHALEIGEAEQKLAALETRTGQGEMARRELVQRLEYLSRVGLGYLSLDRQARTLSGGEAQRVSLTSALGTSLTGALFVLDEPTVGLHVSDLPPLVELMRELADRGNAVIVIEHEPEVIRACNRVVELGPGAGAAGGRVEYDGPPGPLLGRSDLATGRALSAAAKPRELANVAKTEGAEAKPAGSIRVVGARANNLRGVTVDIPLGRIVAFAGASGSGKSSLADDVLYRAIARARGYKDIEAVGQHQRLEGATPVHRVTYVDQSPLGRTSRGNPATYSGAWNRVRAMFGATPDAVEAGLGPGHFSFNVAAGRCEACSGEGAETIEMQFLADVSITCPVCQGKRFREEVLAVKLEGQSVADVLAMTVTRALEFFAAEPAVTRALAPLVRLGLGYLALGQPLSTLSGGEAQRLKVARALAEPSRGALFILDEPSAGLHADEVGHLLAGLRDLVRGGGSVIVVEHDLDVLAASDWIIELGPGAGAHGGEVVACATPAELAEKPTRTGLALAERARAAKTRPNSATKHDRAPSVHEHDHVITVTAAREHNLDEVSVRIPHGKLCVVTGPSGSGKSTLAFDVVFAEGQRRFLETLTPYARQFLPTLPRPDVDRVTGVPPSIALEQRTTRVGSNSTVATVTEVAHYLRLLFAKVGDAHCPTCDRPVVARSPDEVFAAVRASRGARALLAPAVVARKGSYLDVFTAAARAGIQEAIADGLLVSTDKPPKLDKRREHSIDLVVQRSKLGSLDRGLFDRALAAGRGAVKIADVSVSGVIDHERAKLFSTTRTCVACGTGVPELDPRFFSFNTKQGRCEACEGTGADGGPDAVAACEPGHELEPCDECEGSRLAPLPRGVRLAGSRYHEVVGLSVAAASDWARGLSFEGDRARIAEAAHRELVRRLEFVAEVGLTYLDLDRRAGTLSGGEMQRLRLAAQLGSGLTGALYVLDEPTIGLHPRDTDRLLENLRSLAKMGSTVLMVEHDADTIRAADHLIDLGPTGGRGGGRIMAEGAPADVLANPASPTGRALARESEIAASRTSRPKPDAFIELKGARAHNLVGDALRVPAGRLTVVAGVSGSGKSTLVQRVLFPAVRAKLGLATAPAGKHEKLELPASLARAIAVDQSPIGRTSRSTPATFLGVWDEVRKLFAASPDATVRGYKVGRFSFNTPAGGRCTTCDGQGVISHEMSFLPDVTLVCEACRGMRFEPATLDVRYLGLSIGEVLALSAEEAAKLFAAHPKIRAPLETMCDLGVGYLRLGQGSHTLSGGEAQRLKLASELTASARTKPTLYVLDEPTTGLHLADVALLVGVFERLVARGDTLVVIEHHPAVIACADHVIELGPEGGKAGGRIVAQGSPREIARRATATGRVLQALFSRAN